MKKKWKMLIKLRTMFIILIYNYYDLLIIYGVYVYSNEILELDKDFTT